MAAPSDAGQFGHQLANALQLVEQLPNPLFLVYNYVLNIAGGGTSPLIPMAFASGNSLQPYLILIMLAFQWAFPRKTLEGMQRILELH